MHEDNRVGIPRRCHSWEQSLTAREIQVLLLAAEGEQNTAIAHMLKISPRTVEQHVTNMLQKIGANSRAELIARAYAVGILRCGVWPPAWSGARDWDEAARLPLLASCRTAIRR